MSGFLKTVWKIQLALLVGVFFSPETISKVDDIKIKRKVSAFFLPLAPLSTFHYPPFSLFWPFTGPKEALKVQ